MKYAEVREQIKTGDVLLVESGQLFGVLIRILTAQQISHVAMFLWIDKSLFLVDITASKDYQLVPASLRLRQLDKKAKLYWGKAPEPVASCTKLAAAALRYREMDPEYSYFTLLLVWWGQLRKRSTPSRLVCSTLVARLWSLCGFRFAYTPDPGDYMFLSKEVAYLERV